MRYCLHQLMLAALILVSAGCSQAPEDGKDSPSETSSTGKQPWSGQSLNDWTTVFAEMEDVLDLAADEQQQLKATFEQHVGELQAWYREHGPTVAKADREAIQAADAKDLATLRRIKNEVVPLKQEAMAMHEEMDAAVLAVLTESNRVRWQAHRLTARILKLAEPLNLSETQQAQVAELAIDAAEFVKNHDTPQGAGFVELEKKFEARVLDAAQRGQYQTIKDENKLRSLKKYSSFEPTHS